MVSNHDVGVLLAIITRSVMGGARFLLSSARTSIFLRLRSRTGLVKTLKSPNISSMMSCAHEEMERTDLPQPQGIHFGHLEGHCLQHAISISRVVYMSFPDVLTCYAHYKVPSPEVTKLFYGLQPRHYRHLVVQEDYMVFVISWRR